MDTEEQANSEAGQIIAQNRDRLYRHTMVAAIVFCIISAILMAGFKQNEGFFDANSRLGLLLEQINEQDQILSYPKINVKAVYKDERASKLVIRPDMPIESLDIEVREEFTKKKVVITFLEAAEYFADNVQIVSDSAIMDAVGIYRQNKDVVVEVYCKDTYSWTIDSQADKITLQFDALRAAYSGVAVVYQPYADRNRLMIPEWQQSIAEFAANNHMKLFLASNMLEEYTEQEVVTFANTVQADILLGIAVESSETAEQASAVTVCNTTYFIPNFGSTQLAILAAGVFAAETQLVPKGFRECGAEDILVSQAVVPAAFLELTLPASETENVESVYKLNESIVTALMQTLEQAFNLTEKRIESNGM